MIKRIFDIVASIVGLILFSPVLLPVIYLVWRQDGASPFYVADRTGLNNKPFKMVKLRSMIVNADASGVDSTSNADQRITKVGHFIRKFKLDEITQLWNVLKGDMSLVGPRPNVKRETDLYTLEEKKLLATRPGITDFSSIVFSDEGAILEDFKDPDLAYHQYIRPGKSKLGLFYLENSNFYIDIALVFLTALAIFSRQQALVYLGRLMQSSGASEELIFLAARTSPLIPKPPPGATAIVQSREGRSD